MKASVAPVPLVQNGGRFGLQSPLLAAALALFGAAMVIVHADVPAVIRDLALPDNDDLMRLVQVLDLVHGQGWFDKVQHRFGPPAGAPTHWSRLVDAPLALGIVAFRPLFGERLAAGIVSALWPALLLALYLGGTWLVSHRWFGPRAAWLGVLAATQMTTISLFAPGRIDHHNLQILAALGLVVALADPARDRRGAALRGGAAGLLAAAALTIGLESLPFVAFCAGAAALAWVVGRGPQEATRFGTFGAALALAAPVLFAAETAPLAWPVPHCDALSPPWLLLACLGGGGAVVLSLSGAFLRTPRRRLAAAASLGIVTLAPFLILFGGCITSPLGDLPELVRREWLGKVAEALPLPEALRLSPEMVAGGIMPLFVAALVALARSRRDGAESRNLILAGFLATGILVAIVQLRGIYIASAVLPLVAGPAFDRALSLLAGGASPGRSAGALGLALLMFGKAAALPVLAAQAISGREPQAAVTRQLSDCAERTSLEPLVRLAPATILAPVDLGPAILLHTPHSIVAAPYHREAAGIAAALTALMGSEADLRSQVRNTGAGVVALCRSWTDGDPKSFAHRLASGGTAPWLAPIETGTGDLMAWRVIP